MRALTVTVGPLAAASATAVAASQSVTAGNSVVINGSAASNGVATLDTPRRIGIASAGNDSGLSFLISGTDWAGQAISETLVGANAGTAQSVLDYATVTSIKPSGATASTVTVGTTGVASSSWIRLDEYAFPQVALQAAVSGTVNGTVQQSLDDPNSISNPVARASMAWANSNDASAVGFTTTIQSNYIAAPLWTRVTLNSGSGSIRFTAVQAANVPC